MGTGVDWGVAMVGECSGALQKDRRPSPKQQHPPNQRSLKSASPKISIHLLNQHPPNGGTEQTMSRSSELLPTSPP